MPLRCELPPDVVMQIDVHVMQLDEDLPDNIVADAAVVVVFQMLELVLQMQARGKEFQTTPQKQVLIKKSKEEVVSEC